MTGNQAYNNAKDQPLDHPESNIFVNKIYDEYFRWNNPILTKKHLKVVLLDLYVCWNEDPNQQIGILLGSNAYKANLDIMHYIFPNTL